MPVNTALYARNFYFNATTMNLAAPQAAIAY